MRQKFVAGNWKMCTNAYTAKQLAAAVVKGLGYEIGVRVAVCPPAPYLIPVGEVLRGSAVALGAQHVLTEKEGEFSGEVSPVMLADVGCKYVILGHSERRHKLGETDAFINRKVRAALAAGLQAILCVGETLAERQGNRTEAVLDTQLDGSLAALDAADLAKVVLAYEPVWAIGTGQNATPEQAQQAHPFIRARVAAKFRHPAAQALPTQYGASLHPDHPPP